MMVRLLCLLMVIASPLLAQQEQVVLGLSQNRVQITTDFDGSEILIFGAVKREAPLPEGPELQAVVTIAGPIKPMTVFRKARVAGIWVNRDAVEIDAAPTFYAVATSAPWSEALSQVEDLRHRVSIKRAIRSVGAPEGIEDTQNFTAAAIRIRQNDGHYTLNENAIIIDEQTLFRASIQMPANLTEGSYATRIFLTRGGEVIDKYETEILVSKVGLERWLFNLSQQHAFLYGLLSLFIAVIAGWGASTIFRLLRAG